LHRCQNKQQSVPIRHKLQNGDRIEIFTSKNQKPNLDWLNFVVTTKAQKKSGSNSMKKKLKRLKMGKKSLKGGLKTGKIAYNE